MNDAQQQAVSCRVPNVLVSAGAGSGKTMVLTERYADLLLNDGLSVDQILALTFTRKAAQEMRKRIARRLEEAGEIEARRKLPRAPIGTIHSFCERVLHEHALQAGVDPNFRLLDEAEARTLQEKALDAVLEEIWKGSQQEREEIGRLVLEVPQRDLRPALLEVFRYLRTQGFGIEQVEPAQAAVPRETARRLAEAVGVLLSLPGSGKWEDGKREAAAAFAELEGLLQADCGTFTWEYCARAEALLGRLTPAGGPREEAKGARAAIKGAFQAWLGACLDLGARPGLEAFVTLARRLDGGYAAAKAEQSLLDFEDLLLQTRDLLADADGGARERFRKQLRQVMVDEFQDTNPLQFRIISALQGDGHLFVVGDVKQSIFRFIGSDVRVFLEHERRIGGLDGAEGRRIPMHENYRSRPELLGVINGLFDRLWSSGEREEGFTFEPVVAAASFIPASGPALEVALWPADEGAEEQRDREAAWIARRILQLTGRLAEPSLQITARDGAEDAPRPRSADFRDVVMLFRASTDIPRYEEALRRAGVPYYLVSGRGFYQTREVQDLAHMLRVVENPQDDFSLAAVLLSPLVGVSDETLFWLTRDWREWRQGQPYPAAARRDPAYGHLWVNLLGADDIPPLQEDDRRALAAFRGLVAELQAALPAGHPLDLIDLILTRTEYATCLLAADGGDQMFANVQKLREVAADFQRRGIFDLTDFARYLAQLADLAPREASAPLDVEASNVVRLMTIHAAKGLEAPIVVLADCGRSPMRVQPLFLFMPAVGLSCKLLDPDGEWRKPAGYQRALDRQAAEDAREGERLLYVALTRAQERVICSGFTSYPAVEKASTYADLLASLLGLAGPLESDVDVDVEFEGARCPVRVWSPESLAAMEELTPPETAPTLWERYGAEILAGAELPVLTDAAQVEVFSRVVSRMQQMPPARREGPLRVGVHRALCYTTCPRQYWFRYILRSDVAPPERALLPPAVSQSNPPESEIDFAQEEPARTDGTAFGRLLHAVMQRIDLAAPLPAQAPAMLDLAARETGMTTAAEDRDAVAACLGRFEASAACAALRRAAAVHRELRFLARIGDAYMPGIIDVLAREGNRCWLLDYKTGRRAAVHMRQVALYALGARQALGAPPERVVLAYLDLDGPESVRDEPVTPELLDEARRLFLAAEEGIRRETFAPTPGRHCEYCPYLGACPQGQEEVAVAAAAMGMGDA